MSEVVGSQTRVDESSVYTTQGQRPQVTHMGLFRHYLDFVLVDCLRK